MGLTKKAVDGRIARIRRRFNEQLALTTQQIQDGWNYLEP